MDNTVRIVVRAASAALHAMIGAIFLSAQSTPPASLPAVAAKIDFNKQVAPILNRHCSGCHGGKTPRADVRLAFKNEEEARKIALDDVDLWSRVATEVSTRQ